MDTPENFPEIPPAVIALLIRAGVRVLLLGPSGTGKTSFFDALSKSFQDPARQEHGRVLYLNAANLEPQDIEPLSAPGADGQIYNITHPAVYSLIQYDLSLEEHAKQPGYRKPVVVIVLDEITNASPKTLATLLSAVTSRTFSKHAFRNVYPVFVGAGNRPDESSLADFLPFQFRSRFLTFSWPYNSEVFQSFVCQKIFNLVADGLAAEEEEGNRKEHVLEVVNLLKNRILANTNGKDGYSEEITSFNRFLNSIQRWTFPDFPRLENFSDYLDIVQSVIYGAFKTYFKSLSKAQIAEGAVPDSRSLIENVLFPIAIVLAARSSPEWQPYIHDRNIDDIVKAILIAAGMPSEFRKEFLNLWTSLSSFFAKQVSELLTDEYVAGQRPLPVIIHNDPIRANTCADIIYQIAENPKMVADVDLGRPYHDEQHKQRDIIRRLFKLLTQIKLEDPDTWIKAKIAKLDRFERAICDIFLLNHILSGECKAYKEGTYDLYRYKFLEKILSRASRDDVAQMESSFAKFAELLIAENPERYALLHDLAGYIMDRSCDPITHTALAHQGNQKIHTNANQYIPSWSRLQHYAYGLFVPTHLYQASVAYRNLYHEMHTSELLIPKPKGEKTDLTVENINKIYEDILNTDPVFRLFSAGDEQGFIAAITDNPAGRLESNLSNRIAWIRAMEEFYKDDDVIIVAQKLFKLLKQCRQQQLALCSAQVAQ
jgi:hypothetical protein